MTTPDLTNLRALAAKWQTESDTYTAEANRLRSAGMFETAAIHRTRAKQLQSAVTQLTTELDRLENVSPPNPACPEVEPAAQAVPPCLEEPSRPTPAALHHASTLSTRTLRWLATLPPSRRLEISRLAISQSRGGIELPDALDLQAAAKVLLPQRRDTQYPPQVSPDPESPSGSSQTEPSAPLHPASESPPQSEESFLVSSSPDSAAS